MRARDRLVRALSLLVTVFALVLGLASVASATPAFDDSGYSREQRDAATEKGRDAAAAALCAPLPDLGAVTEGCADLVGVLFTAESIADTTLASVCEVFPVAVQSVCESLVDVDVVKTAFTTAYQAALLAVGPAVVAGQLIADAATPFDNWANDRWTESVGLFEQVLSSAADATEFHADRVWWRNAYAATAGLGLVLLAVMLLVTYKATSSGKMSTEDLGTSLTTYLPLFVGFAAFGPPLAFFFARIQSGLTHALVGWQFGDLQAFLDTSWVFTRMSSAMPGGVTMALVLALLLFLAAAGLLFTLVMQTVSLYILGAIAPIAAAMLVHPRWRRKGFGVMFTWLGLLLARPALFLVLGLVLKFENGQAAEAGNALESGDTITGLVAAFMVIVGVGMVALAPWTLLRFFPLLPDGGDSVRAAGGGQLSGAVAGAAASGAIQAGMTRARSNAAHESTASHGVPSDQPRSSSWVGGPGGSGGGGAGGGTGPGAASKGRRAGSTKQAGRTGGASSSGAVGGAGGGAGRAASGAGRITSGGALFAAHVGLSAAQAGLQKAREAADAGAPEIREVTD